MHVDSIRSAPLLEGLAGTRQTLREMAKLVRDDAGKLEIRQTALRIASGCGGHQFDCEISAVFHFCRDQITYRKDPVDNEWVQDATRTIGVFRSGDCDDKVVCLATLLAALGHRSRFVVIGRRPEQYTHVYLEVHTSNGWLSLDPTPERAPVGWQAKGMHRDTYDIWGDEGGGLGALYFIAAGAFIWWILK